MVKEVLGSRGVGNRPTFTSDLDLFSRALKPGEEKVATGNWSYPLSFLKETFKTLMNLRSVRENLGKASLTDAPLVDSISVYDYIIRNPP